MIRLKRGALMRRTGHYYKAYIVVPYIFSLLTFFSFHLRPITSVCSSLSQVCGKGTRQESGFYLGLYTGCLHADFVPENKTRGQAISLEAPQATIPSRSESAV
jgi:hypothetical protein